MSHSPEPWSQRPNKRDGGSYLVDSEEGDIFGEFSMTDEDARRTVACINACKGIPTEDLEAMAKDGLGLYPEYMQWAGYHMKPNGVDAQRVSTDPYATPDRLPQNMTPEQIIKEFPPG